MSLELHQDTIEDALSEDENAKVEARILQLRTATGREIITVLYSGALYSGSSAKFIMERFLETRTIVRGNVQRLFEKTGEQGDIINKTMNHIYSDPSRFRAPQLANFAVHTELSHYGNKHNDKFTLMTAKNVIITENEKDETDIKDMHKRFQTLAAALEDREKRAIMEALAHQYLGLEIAAMISGFQTEEELVKNIAALNEEILEAAELRIAIRNSIAILTTLRSDGKIFVPDTPESRLRFLRNPGPIAKPQPAPKAQTHRTQSNPVTNGKRHSKTIPFKRLTRAETREGIALSDIDTKKNKPKTRKECEMAERPCPYVSCRHHLYLDVDRDTGSIKLNFPDIPVCEMNETCSLDVAAKDGISLEEIGSLLNISYERANQIETAALEKLRTSHQGQELLKDGLHDDPTETFDFLGRKPLKRRKKKGKKKT